MTALEIDKALADIALKKCEECENKLKALPKEAKTERKAVKIEIGMYSMFPRFALLYYWRYGNSPAEWRNHVLKTREKLMLRENLLNVFPKINTLYKNADEQEKELIIAALQGEMFMRNQFYNNYVKELAVAEKSGDTNKVFELRIKVAVVRDGFRLWEEWRNKNNIYPNMF